MTTTPTPTPTPLEVLAANPVSDQVQPRITPHVRPTSPGKPEDALIVAAPDVCAGDLMWLWRMPSSPLQPGWYRVDAVSGAQLDDYDDPVTVIWLPAQPPVHRVPLLFGPTKTCVVFRDQAGAGRG